MRQIRWIALFVSLLLSPVAAFGQRHNVLLIIADDLGVDRIGAYAAVPDPGHTPRIDALAAHGVLFQRAYANPVCSPTRATLLTGRFAYRTGIGLAMNYILDTYELAGSEVSLPQVLAPVTRSSIVGKWHLSAQTVGGLLHPLLVGFEHHLGSITILDGFIGNAYTMFSKNIDGIESPATTYNTTDIVNDALSQITAFGNDPWCLWVAFNAPHAPYHKPPANLHTFTLPPLTNATTAIHTKAMIEAMDTEIGRLLDSMDPAVLANTVVIFIGDNGTDKPAASPPIIPDKVKGTLYEGGIHVPLIISGPGVTSGASCAALVNSTDLFATIAELSEAPHDTATDSISLRPYLENPALPSLRNFAYAEIFQPNGFGPYASRRRTALNDRFKLIWNYSLSDTPGTQEFYDLQTNPTETVNLLLSPPLAPDAQAAYAALRAVLVEQKLLWSSQTHGLAGTTGIPTLTGTGTLIAGAPVTLSVEGARPFAPATMVVGLSYIIKNFKGGVMVPAPDLVLSGLMTDEFGSLVLPANWPAGVPSDTNTYYQCWLLDPAGPAGLAASNALRSSTP